MEVTGCLTLKDLISTKKSKAESVIDVRSSQKENMYDRFRISPRALLKPEPIDLSKQKGFTPERIPVTPVKSTEKQQPDPWTPTANLKMLISVASPEIRDWEKKKELFRPIENNEQEESTVCSQQFEAVDDIDDLEKRPSRKQKSLGLLCQKFLARYPSYPMSTEKTTISLDEAAASLGVERRRIYDIVNVLESLNLVSRVAKNQYCWHGQHNLNETLKGLQHIGESHKYEAQIAYFQHKELGVELKSGERRKEFPGDTQHASLLGIPDIDCPSASASSRKDKSLRIMSQKFVMLFLASTTKIITLEIAAKILIEESPDAADHSKFKTKVRRLYDIANVLTSLGLIKKVHVTEERGRKPAFKWIGPADFRSDNAEEIQRMEVTASSQVSDYKREASILFPTFISGKEKMPRHSSFNHVQTSAPVKRKVCSEPSSPHKTVCCDGSDTYSSKMAHLAAVCRQKIEEDSKSQTASSENTVLGNMDPFPVVVPVDSEYGLTPVLHQGSNVLQKVINGQIGAVPTSLPSAEQNNQGLLPNQPYMYLPSSSFFMLYGKPREEHLLHAEKHRTGSLEALERSGTTSPTSNVKKGLSEDDLPSKRQRIDVQQMNVLQSARASSHQNTQCDTTKSMSSGRAEEMKISKANKRIMSETEAVDNTNASNQAHPDSVNQTAFPPYLYVTSAAGLNGFNFFLPANQTAGALGLTPSQLTSLNIPCMVVPSTSLAGFPIICSPAVTSSIPSTTAGSSSSSGGMHFSLSDMTPATHLFGAPKVSELSTDLPRSESPMPRLCNSSIKSHSPTHVGQMAPIQKSQKSPTPLTPKSIRPAHKESFFKTPSGVGVSSYFRKSEGAQYSSAQRRLEISSSVGD
ncbi:transcription factor E2F7 [Discoglossus pictus]